MKKFMLVLLFGLIALTGCDDEKPINERAREADAESYDFVSHLQAPVTLYKVAQRGNSWDGYINVAILKDGRGRYHQVVSGLFSSLSPGDTIVRATEYDTLFMWMAEGAK